MTPQRACIVTPVYQGREFLERSGPAIAQIRDPRLLEWIVVDDSSTDGSGDLARELGARVLDSGGRVGPGAARNQAVAASDADLVVFVDADVVLHPDTFGRIVDAFSAEDVVAVFGAYDDSPAERNTASLYVNLRHHHVHQVPSENAATFWAGLGAVRRDAFVAVGGFDVAQFQVPSVEDIELGLRMRQAGGRIRRVPDIQAKHLKHWSLAEWIRTDLLKRAIPWARLMREHPGEFDDLNVNAAEKAKALVAGGFFAALGLAIVGLISWGWAVALFALAASVNRPLLALFRRRGGLGLAVRALALHQVYYVMSAGVFVWDRARAALASS